MSELITARLRGRLAGRLAAAQRQHAGHVLTHMGDPAIEPGPHAILLLSVEPAPIRPVEGPAWAPVVMETATAHPVVASRLVLAQDEPDLLPLLTRLTKLAERRTAAAAQQGRLLAHLSTARAAAIGEELGDPWNWRTDPVRYQAAVDAGLIWDPRTMTGLGMSSVDPITDSTRYIGVAVISLDAPEHPYGVPQRWTDTKHRWRRTGTEQGLPMTTPLVPTAGWALLEDGTALHVTRSARGPHQQVTADVISTAAVGVESLDRLNAPVINPGLVTNASPLGPRATTTAQTSTNLWAALNQLHTVLRAAFGYRSGPNP